MKYRYKKSQIFRKKLNVPEAILGRIYEKNATIDDFKRYHLSDKIPLDCLEIKYRYITEIVGFPEAFSLNWNCIFSLSFSEVLSWFRAQEKGSRKAKDWNDSLYFAIHQEFMENVKNGEWNRYGLLGNMNYTNYNFYKFGDRFQRMFPELFYTNQFYVAKYLFSSEKFFSFQEYVRYREDFKNIPDDIILNKMYKEDKILFVYYRLKEDYPEYRDFLEQLQEENVCSFEFLTSSSSLQDKILVVLESPRFCYKNNLPKSFVYRHEDYFFLEKNYPFLEKLYNEKQLTPECIQKYEECWNIPESKKIAKHFKETDYSRMIQNVGNSKFLELCRKYGKHLMPIPIKLQGSYEDTIEIKIIKNILENNVEYEDLKNVPSLVQRFPTCFLDDFYPYSFQTNFYTKKLTPECIQSLFDPNNHYDIKQIANSLVTKQIFLGFRDPEMILFIKTIGNHKFIELCKKYGKHLVPVVKKEEYETYENCIETEIMNKIQSGAGDYEDLENVSSLVQKIPEYFVSSDTPFYTKYIWYQYNIRYLYASMGLDKNISYQLIIADLNHRLSCKNHSDHLRPFDIQTGDYVKGILDFELLKNVLHNKTFVESSSKKEDCQKISGQKVKKGYISNGITLHNMQENDSFYFVFKKKNQKDKSSFGFDEIDFIVVQDFDVAIGLEIVKSGLYIPVVDKTNHLVFSADDYDRLRKKMFGLDRFGFGNYVSSDSLSFPEIENRMGLLAKEYQQSIISKNAIYQHFLDVFKELNVVFKDFGDENLKSGNLEILDIGPSGRATNLSEEHHFKFLFRFDEELFQNSQKMLDFKIKLVNSLKQNNVVQLGENHFSFSNVLVNELSTPVHVDITFLSKTDHVEFSSNIVVNEYLQHIKQQEFSNYSLILANILWAKEVLKQAGIYKSEQGGISEIGIENWILQHGGSFYQAATSFLEVAEGKNFLEFANAYVIWNLSENQSLKNNIEPSNYINFMNEQTYQNMIVTLQKNLDYMRNHEAKQYGK